ncbi:MAG: peptidylprolyl isomerase [Oscillospiraceae bacterium]|nr:peptidylprolyl isomerase [Oscillospiraceae bacterium]
MKKLKLPALLLALALLAGCTSTTPKETDALTGDDLAFRCAGVKKDFPLLTVDGETVEAEEYLFWLTNSIMTADSYGVLTDEEAWASMAEDIKADALEVAILYQVIENKAAQLGITFDEEMKAQFDADFNTAVVAQGGREAYQTYLDGMCVSWEGFEKINQVYYLNQAIQEKLTESGELTVTQADYDAFVSDYLEENTLYAAKHILIATQRRLEDGSVEEYSDEEKAKAYQLALNLREQLLDDKDSEETFDRLMKEFSEDGRDADGNLYAPDGYNLVYQGQMVPEFEEASLALEVGQVSGVVQTDYGYHIILRIPLDTTELETYAQQYITENYKMNLLVQQWMDEATTVTDPAYDTIDPKDFYERLTACNAEMHPAETAEPTESAN